MSDYTQEEKDAILVVSILAACFSLLGSLFIIVMFLGYSNLRSFAYRLILYLSICDAGSAIFVIIGPSADEGSACEFQAFGTSFFNLASVLWVGVIAFTLYKSVIGQHQKIESFEKWYLISIFSYCFVLSLLPFTTDSYAISRTGFCWISEQKDRDSALAWQMIQFYIPLWTVFLFSSVCYYKVARTLNVLMSNFSHVEQAERDERISNVNRIRYFPLVLIIAWIFGTINRIYLFDNYDDPSFALTLLHNLFGNLVGLMNCIVYGLNAQVKKTFKMSCAKCLPCIDGGRNELEMVPPQV